MSHERVELGLLWIAEVDGNTLTSPEKESLDGSNLQNGEKFDTKY